jgi:hypothetical protein
MKIYKIILIFLSIILLTSCTYKKTEYPVFRYDNETVAMLSALAHANDINGTVSQILPTGSMRPAIYDYDYVIISNPSKDSFENVKEGDIVLYRADWAPPLSPPVLHRTVEKDRYGWIMTGDNEASPYENKTRLTSANYLGRLVAIYRLENATPVSSKSKIGKI